MYNCPRCGKEQTTWRGTFRGLCEECETTLNKAIEKQVNAPESKRDEYTSTDSLVDLAGYAACGFECRQEPL